MQEIRRAIAGSDLNRLIQEEKDVIKTLQKNLKEKEEAVKYFNIWASKSDEGSINQIRSLDLKDISEKYTVLCDHLFKAQAHYLQNYTSYRQALKEIKHSEEELSKLKAFEKSLKDKVQDASKKQKPVDSLVAEHKVAEKVYLEKQAAHYCNKRKLLQRGLHVQMDGMIEMCAKSSIVATFSKYLFDQIPQGNLAPGQTPPTYRGRDVSTKIVGDCLKTLREWNNPNHITDAFDLVATLSVSSESFTDIPEHFTANLSNIDPIRLSNPPTPIPQRPLINQISNLSMNPKNNSSMNPNAQNRLSQSSLHSLGSFSNLAPLSSNHSTQNSVHSENMMNQNDLIRMPSPNSDQPPEQIFNQSLPRNTSFQDFHSNQINLTTNTPYPLTPNNSVLHNQSSNNNFNTNSLNSSNPTQNIPNLNNNNNNTSNQPIQQLPQRPSKPEMDDSVYKARLEALRK